MEKEDKKIEQVPAPKYSNEEQEYIGRIRDKMATARNLRENAHDEFDGMTFSERCEANRKWANAFIAPKKNKEDTTFVTATTRQKMETLISTMQNYSFDREQKAFDSENVEDVELSQALTHIQEKTLTLENDDEKKLARQYVLLEQGDVFWEEVWSEKHELIKTEKVKFDGSNFDKYKWEKRLKKVGEAPESNLLLHENVYLGDITIWGSLKKQPFIFTVQQIPYDEAKSTYGKWERWENVSKTVKAFDQNTITTAYNNNWSITEVAKDHVEILKYQDRWNNEYAIIINGILMTPAGMPIPRKWGKEIEYNIEMQTLGIISPFFSYSRGIPFRMRTKQALLDEMHRALILKTQKSLNPPLANNTGTILSSRINMPGTITNGIDGGQIKPIGDSNGVSKSELTMIQMLEKGMDDDSASSALQAKNPAGVSRVTATQAQQQRTQAEIGLNLIVSSFAWMEIKAGNMRNWNILENWFQPIGTYPADDVLRGLQKKYRSVNIDTMLEGEGAGQTIVQGSDKRPTTQEEDDLAKFNTYKQEQKIKEKTGKPTKIVIVYQQAIEEAKHTWHTVCEPVPRKKSDLKKVLASEMISGALNMFPETANREFLSEEYAKSWEMDPQKMFQKAQPTAPGQEQPEGAVSPSGAGARGKTMNKKMTQAGKPQRPSVNAMQQ
jgi:hypothetical protein